MRKQKWNTDNSDKIILLAELVLAVLASYSLTISANFYNITNLSGLSDSN